MQTRIPIEIRRRDDTSIKLMHDDVCPTVERTATNAHVNHFEIPHSSGCTITHKDAYTIVTGLNKDDLNDLFGSDDVRVV